MEAGLTRVGADDGSGNAVGPRPRVVAPPYAVAVDTVTSSSEPALLLRLARRSVWWKPAEEAVQTPDRVISQIMNMGDWDDVAELVECVGSERFASVLRSAAPGVFNARSWHYWHYRLGMARFGEVPELPVRRVAFQPSESVKALSYFGDGDLHSLDLSTRNALASAAALVGELPETPIISRSLTE